MTRVEEPGNGPGISLSRRRLHRTVAIVFYALSALQFVSFYVYITRSLLDYKLYLAGGERLPFQERVLPILVLKPLSNSVLFQKLCLRLGAMFMPAERGAFFILSLLSLCVAGWFCVKLYGAVSRTRAMRYLVWPVFLYAVLSTYVIMIKRFCYPYDMPSLAFFTAGLYFIYTRKFLPLLLVILIGTWNRETTLFLIGIYVIDCASREDALPGTRLRDRFDLSQVPVFRVLLLGAIWSGIIVFLHRRFAHNDPSEDFLRLGYNLHYLKPKYWAGLVNVCGYLIPVVLLLRRKIGNARFANYLWILPFWVGIMCCKGVLTETRIYGELCALATVCAVVITENCLVIAVRREEVPEPEPALLAA